MPLYDLSTLCFDFILECYPDPHGGHLADLMAAALSEAESFLLGSHHALCDWDIRSHPRSIFDGHQVEPGFAEFVARACWYGDLCSEWVLDLDTGDLPSMEVAFAINVAVWEARSQMKAGRWPSSDLAMGRMFWLLRQAISRQRQSVRRWKE